MCISLENIIRKTIATFVLHSFRVAGYWKCNNKTPTLI